MTCIDLLNFLHISHKKADKAALQAFEAAAKKQAELEAQAAAAAAAGVCVCMSRVVT